MGENDSDVMPASQHVLSSPQTVQHPSLLHDSSQLFDLFLQLPVDNCSPLECTEVARGIFQLPTKISLNLPEPFPNQFLQQKPTSIPIGTSIQHICPLHS
jgi:hypothetical protein